jgi:hypothetical protein
MCMDSMLNCRFILLTFALFAGCHPNWVGMPAKRVSEPIAVTSPVWMTPGTDPVVIYETDPVVVQPQPVAPIVSGPVFTQVPSPVAVLPQPVVPIVPGPALVQVPPPVMVLPQPAAPMMVPEQVPAPPKTPIPSPQLPGVLGGTNISSDLGFPSGPSNLVKLPNPLYVPVGNDELAWEKITGVVSEYFRIAQERRARRSPEVLIDGTITTAPLAGATIFEPQRKDSVGAFNRWQSTFQTIRRFAIIEVRPDPTGYLVSIQVEKQLEDLLRPQESTAGQAILQYDNTIPLRDKFEVSRTRESGLWIPLGRDIALEQQMLANIQAQFSWAVQVR